MYICSCRKISTQDYATEKDLIDRLHSGDHKCGKCMETVKSPCIKICTPDEDNVYCVGCLRTLDEIREWFILSDSQKLDILEKIKKRGNENIL